MYDSVSLYHTNMPNNTGISFMINLLAMKRYEETNIAPLHPASPRRGWWNDLPFDVRNEIAIRWAEGKDIEADKQLAEDNA
jgi:hypothetical protein